MNETLWRNGILLGELVVPTPATRGGIAGMFVPTPNYVDIVPVWQFRVPILPGSPVFEQRLPDRSGPASAIGVKGFSSYTSCSDYPLKPLSDEEAKGIPASHHLELRDAQGRRLDVDTIMLDRFPIPPAGTESEIWDACEAAGVAPSGWIIAAFPQRPMNDEGGDGDLARSLE